MSGANGANGHDTVAATTLKLEWYAQLHEVSAQTQLVKGLLLAGTLFVIYGESNSGKTFFTLDLGLSVASGAPWRGLRTRPGLVIYVAGEGAGSVRNRVAAYRLANPSVAAGIPFAIIPYSVDFLSDASVGVLIHTIQAAQGEAGESAALIIIDTFARSMAGGDENSARDVGVAVAAADRIRDQTGACVGFIHHAGKDATKGARGSSALRAAVDTEILIEGTQGVRSATVVKQRDLESGQVMPFELHPVQIGFDTEDGAPILSCVVKHQDDALPKGEATALQVGLRGRAQRQFLAALRARNTPDAIYTMSELRLFGKEIGLSKSTARSAVDALVSTPYMQPTLGGYRFTDGEAPRA